MRTTTILLVLVLAHAVSAQQTQPPPNPAKADAPDELGKIKNTCGQLKILGCAEQLFTGQPIHIAVGSIAPQNGFGAGVAYVGHANPRNWRISWNADAVGSNNASWRAGVYAKFVHTATKKIGIVFGTKNFKPNLTNLPEHSVISLYAQAISLNKLTYFGLGPNSAASRRSFYGMRETIVGSSGVKPIYEPLKISLYGEANGRFVQLRPSHGQSSPSIEQLYIEATAPGLTSQPATVQLAEGLRMTPVLLQDEVRLNYRATYEQYFAAGRNFTFQRLTFDLGHQFAFYGKTTRFLTPRHGNGPDECALDPGAKDPKCPEVFTRNKEGSLDLRLFTALSMTPGGNTVPFYFQPTLGGADINGNPWLSSYQDYRFRAPNVLLLRESFEHSLGPLPIGITLLADQGKVALTRGDLGSAGWRHTFAGGFTLRAGGFPMVYLLFAWGGREGNHTIANVNTSLLGGSYRPSLY